MKSPLHRFCIYPNLTQLASTSTSTSNRSHFFKTADAPILPSLDPLRLDCENWSTYLVAWILVTREQLGTINSVVGITSWEGENNSKANLTPRS